jgi:outer membrane protein TolC
MLMNSKTSFFIALAVAATSFFILSGSKAHAQDTVKNLSLNEAIEAAMNNNKSIQLATLDENIASANYRQTNAIFLPEVNAAYTAMSTDNPLNAFGFKLQQRSITQNDFDPGRLNHPGATADFMAKLEVQQPLLNIDMLYTRKGVEKQTEVFRYKTQRSREYATFEVQKAWLQLQLAYDALNMLNDAIKTARAVYKFTDDHYKQGLIQKSDVLNAQVHLASVESSLTKAQSNIRNMSDYLSMLMGAKTGVIYKTETSFIPQPATGTNQKVTSTRADFMAMQKAIEASDMMIKASRMSYVPKLNAFGNYQYNDSHLTGFGANSYFVGVQLSWDIFKGNATKNKIIAQKLERNKLALQLAQQQDQDQVELNKAIRDIADAQAEIDKGNAAVDQAAESLRILQNRYQQGLVNTTDMLMAESQLLQQRFDLAQAVFTRNVTSAYLQLLTSSTKK